MPKKSVQDLFMSDEQEIALQNIDKQIDEEIAKNEPDIESMVHYMKERRV